MFWAGYAIFADVYNTWLHGIEKPATVISLQKTVSRKLSTPYYYRLNIDLGTYGLTLSFDDGKFVLAEWACC